MSCPACSRRVLSLFVESSLGHQANLRPAPRQLVPNALRQTHLRPFSTRPAARFTALPRFLDSTKTDGSDKSFEDLVVSSNAGSASTSAPSTPVDAPADHGVSGADTDPDPSDLMAQLGAQPELPVQSRLWELTGGLSGTKPITEADKKAKEKARAKAAENKVEKRAKHVESERSRKRDRESDMAKKTRQKMEPWQVQKEALKDKFGEAGWAPPKRLSPDALEGIRALHRSDPKAYTTPVLANEFKVSPEAIRRILRSKWQPTAEEQEDRMERWHKRGEQIWTKKAEVGVKPPKKWREMGVGSVRGGKGVRPAWKQRGGSRMGRGGGRQDDVPFREEPVAARAAGPGFNDDRGWGDRIL